MMETAAQEQLRQRYLAAMGVTPWLPLKALPGAAASPTGSGLNWKHRLYLLRAQPDSRPSSNGSATAACS